ncbi:hypothetical protein [Cohnella sp. AR92]|uniref:hypothetical protein n=1 Tax=Cohnella sp. AR92 TaxID=648716 RepID=UPI0013152216|nr:hypothetical protein [Cohnella sp. AR92]
MKKKKSVLHAVFRPESLTLEELNRRERAKLLDLTKDLDFIQKKSTEREKQADKGL